MTYENISHKNNQILKSSKNTKKGIDFIPFLVYLFLYKHNKQGQKK